MHETNVRSISDGIRELDPGEYPAAARVITDALLHDPGWLAVGPRRTNHRRLVMLRYHRACLAVTHRYGRPIYGAFRDDDRLVGVAATFATGRYPPPPHTFLRYVPSFLLAGPGPSVRALRTSAVMDKNHPHDEHVYLWHLSVDPARQRGGVGRALLKRVFEDAAGAVPVWLETANPANVPYYASNGFEEVGRASIPRGATMWFMRRP